MFNPGDIVEVIRPDPNYHLHLGSRHKIKSVQTTGNVTLESNSNISWYADRFKLVKSKESKYQLVIPIDAETADEAEKKITNLFATAHIENTPLGTREIVSALKELGAKLQLTVGGW